MTPTLRAKRSARLRHTVAAVAAGSATLLGVAGCGIQSSGVKVVGAAPVVQPAGDLAGTPKGGGGPYSYELYFFNDGRLAPVRRYSQTQIDQTFLLRELLIGPSKSETAEGFVTMLSNQVSVTDMTAQGEAWAYQLSQDIGRDARAEIVCSIQANLADASSVGTVYGNGQIIWNICVQDFDDLGAPAFLGPLAASSTAPSSVSSGN